MSLIRFYNTGTGAEITGTISETAPGVLTFDPFSNTAVATANVYDVQIGAGAVTDVAGNPVLAILIGANPLPITAGAF